MSRMFLYSLMAAAQVHGPGRRPVYLVVDEFQRIVSKNVELFLQQARGMDIGCLFANQAMGDLATVGADLVNSVRTNCRVRQVFGAGDPVDIADILDTAGETVYAARSWVFGHGLWQWALQTMSVAEQRAPRLSVNDVLLATDSPGRNIAYVRRGEGYAQYGGMPFLMDSVYHISGDEYDERKKYEWPKADERTMVTRLGDAGKPLVPPPIILGDPPPDPADLVRGPAPAISEEADVVADLVASMEEDYIRHAAERDALRRKSRRRSGPGNR